MKTATLADIVLSAQAAANKASGKETLEQQTIKLAEFAAAGFDKLDFPTWENSFNGQLEMLTHFSKQPSPATLAAKRQDAAAQPTAPAAAAPQSKPAAAKS